MVTQDEATVLGILEEAFSRFSRLPNSGPVGRCYGDREDFLFAIVLCQRIIMARDGFRSYHDMIDSKPKEQK